MKIYTKTGDDGTTGLLGAGRVLKFDPRIEAYGTIDELNAVLGLARAAGTSTPTPTRPSPGSRTTSSPSVPRWPTPTRLGKFHNAVRPELSARLETEIDAIEATLPPLTQFILPGGTAGAAQLHLARTICRRAERMVVRLDHTPEGLVPPNLAVYLNRLSDHLFVLARAVNHRAGHPDAPWTGL